MKTAAVICEYNPFHYGHKYQLEQTRAAGATAGSAEVQDIYQP